MFYTDYAPNHLLPQSDPLKNGVMIVIHITFLPVIASSPPIEAQWEVWLRASPTGGLRCDYCNADSTVGKMQERKPPISEAISVEILILYQIFKLLFINGRE